MLCELNSTWFHCAVLCGESVGNCFQKSKNEIMMRQMKLHMAKHNGEPERTRTLCLRKKKKEMIFIFVFVEAEPRARQFSPPDGHFVFSSGNSPNAQNDKTFRIRNVA